MSADQHPITPPPELVNLWMSEDAPWDSDSFGVLTARPSQLRHIATQAARWGADQELEACVEWASCFNYDDYRYDEVLRDIRRPKPPSLNSIALQMLGTIERDARYLPEITDTIRKALEQLDD